MQLTFDATHARPYDLPLRPPIKTPQGRPMVQRRGVVLALRCAGNVVGLGDFAPWPGFAGTSTDEGAEVDLAALARAFDQGAAAALVGQTIALPDLWDGSLAHVAHALEALMALAHHVPAALHGALQTALLDVMAQLWRKPLARLLALEPAFEVPVHALVDSAWAAHNACAQGYTALKVKVGRRAISDELGTLCAIRSAVGQKVSLRLDANGAWPQHVAVQALRMFASVNPDWLEQPIAPGDLAGLRALRELAITPIAVDESVFDGPSLQQVLDVGAADGVVLKPAFVGGVHEAVRLGRQVQAAGVHLSITHALESSVGRAAALQVALALGVQDACGLGGVLLHDPWEAPTIRCGVLRAPEGFGLGVPGHVWHPAHGS